MIGYVEVYRKSGEDLTLVASGDNLVVNGGSEKIVEMLTTPPGIGEISDLSSLLDTSNYTIQAISFGTDWLGLSGNSHQEERLVDHNVLGEIVSAPSWVVDGLDCSVYQYRDNFNAIKSLNENSLQSAPTTTDTRLEETTRPRGTNPTHYYLGEGTALEASSFQDRDMITSINYIGQHGNHIQYPEFMGNCDEDLVVYLEGALSRGTFGPSDGSMTLMVSSTAGSVASVGTLISAYNNTGNMDANGFVRLVPGSVDPSGSLIVSAIDPDFSSTGEIIYQTQMDPDDITTLQLYGGVFSLGLWSIDIKKNQKLGKVPPFTYSPDSNLIEYKLFSKKVFTKSLTYYDTPISPGSTAQEDKLLITWRITF